MSRSSSKRGGGMREAAEKPADRPEPVGAGAAGPGAIARSMSRSPAAVGRPRPPAAPSRALSAARRVPEPRAAMVLLWLLVMVPPLWFSPSAQDSFRLPKLMLYEWLGLASLLPLAWRLRHAAALDWRDVWRQAAVRAALPLILVATLGLAVTRHPQHVHQALADLWIGALCLAGWSTGLDAPRLERVLGWLLWPGVILAVFGILQFHGLQPLAFAGISAGSRLAITSTAGNPGDLAAFLVLPCLISQWRLARETGRAGPRPERPARPEKRAERSRPEAARQARGAGPSAGRSTRLGWLVAALAVCAYAVAVTQTLAALAAVVLGSLILWGMVLFGGEAGAGAGERSGDSGQDGSGASRGWSGAWRPVLLLGAILALAVGVVVAVPSLRARAAAKLRQARQGSWDEVLTGRLDGWRAALWMFDQHPWAGVGHGAYRTEFVPAKLALLARGTAFSPGQQQNFVNAHDEVLEVAADSGLPGLLALLWGCWVVVAALHRRVPGLPGSSGKPVPPRARGPADLPGHALAVAGTAALAVLCLVDFPFRIGLVAFPALLFLAWVLRPAAGDEVTA